MCLELEVSQWLKQLPRSSEEVSEEPRTPWKWWVSRAGCQFSGGRDRWPLEQAVWLERLHQHFWAQLSTAQRLI